MTKNLSYLSYPLPPDIQRLFEAGDFDRMARVIRQRLEDPRVPKTLHERLRFQLIIAKEIPEYYRLTQADMLAILQENINDFTEDELEALRDDGTLDWRYINGEVHFRNNCLVRCSRCARNTLACQGPRSSGGGRRTRSASERDDHPDEGRGRHARPL